jgi:Zn ribbon nucleic-acid-binding protein
MASVIDNIECPNCKHEAYHDYYYKTGEEYVNCNNCGYHYSATIINRDKKLNELTKKDWEIVECKKPYGSYRIGMVEGVGFACGSLRNKKEYNALKTEYIDNNQIRSFTISRFLNGEIVVETVI